MKAKNFLIAFIVMLLFVHTSGWGRTYDGERTVTTSGNIDLTSWITPVGKHADYLLKIPLEWVDPQLVNTGVGAWNSPFRAFPVGYPMYEEYKYAQWAPSLLPGTHAIDGGAKGGVLYDISFITDPWVGVDQPATEASPHLSSFDGTITAQSSVSLKLSNLWANPGYTKKLYKDETLISDGNITIQINQSGDYALLVAAGADSPADIVYFKVVITGVTPTVSSVLVSPASASVNKGTGQQFTATVQGTNSPGQEVSWTVEGKTSAATTISASGYLSVANDENATQLIVRATSVVDPSKSGTATVNVITPTPTPTQYTITLVANPSNGGTVSGGGTFDAGTSQTVVATATSGWTFVNWTENGNVVSTDVTYSFTLNGNRTLQATFEVIPPQTWKVSFTVNVADAQILLGDRTQAGNYTFDNVAAGTYAYTVSKDGYQTVSGTVEVVDRDITIQITLIEKQPEALPKSPVFKGLLGEYSAGSAPIELKVVGEGIEGLTFTYKVNGIPATTFVPTAGEHLIEAISDKVEIQTKVRVN
ncbi:MAG: hypothetical protein LBS46_04485 [Dysgonamonadaceae bacterium]|nr:hypothetical protein [Dysgonamonadaceae bacterium]